MFFRYRRPKTPAFDERLQNVRNAGFTVSAGSDGAARVERGGFAVELRDDAGLTRADGRAGLLLCGEIASLVDGGFQKFFRTPGGNQQPALAEELEGLHNFEEDLKEALGQQSYYNESLGTVSTFCQYDRVQDRDRGVPKRAWE